MAKVHRVWTYSSSVNFHRSDRPRNIAHIYEVNTFLNYFDYILRKVISPLIEKTALSTNKKFQTTNLNHPYCFEKRRNMHSVPLNLSFDIHGMLASIESLLWADFFLYGVMKIKKICWDFFLGNSQCYRRNNPLRSKWEKKTMSDRQ